MIVQEVSLWIGRILTIIPEVIKLWDAAKVGDAQQELEAQLALTRAIKDRQAREEIGGT